MARVYSKVFVSEWYCTPKKTAISHFNITDTSRSCYIMNTWPYRVIFSCHRVVLSELLVFTESPSYLSPSHQLICHRVTDLFVTKSLSHLSLSHWVVCHHFYCCHRVVTNMLCFWYLILKAMPTNIQPSYFNFAKMK